MIIIIHCPSGEKMKLMHEKCCALLCLVAQLCLTLCDPMSCSLPGSLSMGIL